jgi:hypothetical protein
MGKGRISRFEIKMQIIIIITKRIQRRKRRRCD